MNGCFETMYYTKGKIPLLDLHFKRLNKSLAALCFDTFTKSELDSVLSIYPFLKKNKSYRIKFSSERDTPFATFNFTEVQEFNQGFTKWNAKGWNLISYKKSKINYSPYSFIKKNKRTLYNNATQFAKDNNYDDALIYNKQNQIAETSIANIFIVKDNCIYTPPLSSGCVSGVMRGLVISICKKNDIPLRQKAITENDIATANEVFITNALRGIIHINNIDGKIFKSKKMAYQLYKLLQKNIDV